MKGFRVVRVLGSARLRVGSLEGLRFACGRVFGPIGFWIGRRPNMSLSTGHSISTKVSTSVKDDLILKTLFLKKYY